MKSAEVWVAQFCLTLCDPIYWNLPASLFMRFYRQEYWSGLPFLSPGDLPNLGIKPRSPALQENSLLVEPPGKPKNTGVGSLSLLQGIFLTQKSNRGLLHCREILYQLSYQGSPDWPLCCAVLCLVTQSFLTLCDPMDYSLPGSSVYGDSPSKNTGAI